MKLETVFFWDPAIFKLQRLKKDIFIENTTVSEEHQIQEILSVYNKNVSKFGYFLPKLKRYIKKKN